MVGFLAAAAIAWPSYGQTFEGKEPNTSEGTSATETSATSSSEESALFSLKVFLKYTQDFENTAPFIMGFVEQVKALGAPQTMQEKQASLENIAQAWPAFEEAAKKDQGHPPFKWLPISLDIMIYVQEQLVAYIQSGGESSDKIQDLQRRISNAPFNKVKENLKTLRTERSELSLEEQRCLLEEIAVCWPDYRALFRDQGTFRIISPLVQEYFEYMARGIDDCIDEFMTGVTCAALQVDGEENGRARFHEVMRLRNNPVLRGLKKEVEKELPLVLPGPKPTSQRLSSLPGSVLGG